MKTEEIGILPLASDEYSSPDSITDWEPTEDWTEERERLGNGRWRAVLGLAEARRAGRPPSHAPWMTADSGYHDDNSGTDNTRGIGTANSNWPAEVQRLEPQKRHLVKQTNM